MLLQSARKRQDDLAEAFWLTHLELSSCRPIRGVIGSFLERRSTHGEFRVRLDRVVRFFLTSAFVGRTRDVHETGEIKRVVSSLLLQIDSLPSYVVVVAASNHPELLDRAVWRRFQIRLELAPPTQLQITKLIQSFERRTNQSFGMQSKVLAQKLRGLSFAVEDFITEVCANLF